jgi:hypothetical protein
MLKIPVIYVNGQRGIVDAEDIEILIKARKIVSFRRSSGWVRVAFDLIRGEEVGEYSGPDRRNMWLYYHISKLRLVFSYNETDKYHMPHSKFTNRLFKNTTEIS